MHRGREHQSSLESSQTLSWVAYLLQKWITAKHLTENIVLMLHVIQWLFSRNWLPHANVLHRRLLYNNFWHTTGQKKANCLLSNVSCFCLISFKVKTVDIMTGYHKGTLFNKIWMVAENEERNSFLWNLRFRGSKKDKNTGSSLRSLKVKRRFQKIKI